MKNKFITTVVATALALTMTFSLANGMDVKAKRNHRGFFSRKRRY